MDKRLADVVEWVRNIRLRENSGLGCEEQFAYYQTVSREGLLLYDPFAIGMRHRLEAQGVLRDSSLEIS